MHRSTFSKGVCPPQQVNQDSSVKTSTENLSSNGSSASIFRQSVGISLGKGIDSLNSQSHRSMISSSGGDHSRKKKGTSYYMAAFFLAVGMLVAYNYNTLYRLVNVLMLDHPSHIVDNFRSMHERGFPYTTVKRGPEVSKLVHYNENFAHHFPKEFSHEGELINVDEFLQDSWTTGLVVLKVKDDARHTSSANGDNNGDENSNGGKQTPHEVHVLYENYYRGATHETRAISWSVGKSFVSALCGIAFHEGLIHSLDDDVVKYAPEFKGSGYDGVSLKHVLQMSSGVRFNEDYGDFYSDINVMGRTLAMGTPINQFAASLQREREPGNYNHYVSMDTQVVGAVLSNVVKETYGSLSKYLEEKIWKKVGFEQDSFWLLDNDQHQMELAFGTINAVPRDFARFGLLYLNEGRSPLSGEQLVHPDWVRDSVTPDAPHLMPGWGNPQSPDYPFGYGYQWWILGKEDKPDEVARDYLAIGVYNQFIYINPEHGIVIAKNSAYQNYTKDQLPSEQRTVSFFRAVVKALADY